jgi:CheY-like chemotaxis protein
MTSEHASVTHNAELQRGLILVVDDDHIVLNATKRLLEALSYKAICAASVEEAMDLVRQQGPRIRLALLDYRLPGEWDGIQLLQAIREILNWNLPAVLISGDTSIDRLKQVRISGLPLLHKPIELSVLRRYLDEVMSGEELDQDIE